MHITRNAHNQTKISRTEFPGRYNKVLQNKTIPLVKVLWKNSKSEEATWELEADMKEKYPELFV